MTSAITVSGLSQSQLATVRRTVAKDANEDEFNLFMEICKSTGLNPFRKQVFSIIYSKDNPEKRNQVLIVSRDGLRVIAQRCADYRPADAPPIYEIDEALKCSNNPNGLISATVKLYKQDRSGDWYPVVGQAYWDEFAPLKPTWEYNESAGKRLPTGPAELDKTGKWATMGRNMLAKCAESAALRAGWPDQFGGLYSEEEIGKHEADISASDALNVYEAESRQKLLGGPGVMMVFDDSARLEKVSFGAVFDRVSEFIQGATPEEAHKFQVRNVEAIREFWGHDKPAALELKARLEKLADQFNPESEAA